MEKYAVVKEKLKKLSVEQTRGDSYDPFLPAQKEVKNAYSKQPQNRSPQGSAIHNRSLHERGAPRAAQTSEQLAFNVESAQLYPSQAAAFSVARAIGTLQERSHQESHAAEISSEISNDAPRQPFVTEPAAYENDLITQEIHRLELRAMDINNRSQQQIKDILALKRTAQQAAIAFARQGIHDHPQLEIINRFFDRYAASHVPIIERDNSGHFTLNDYSINLRRAEEEAIENAAVLRGNRHSAALPAVVPFSQPIGETRRPAQNARLVSGAARTQRRSENGGLTPSSMPMREQLGNAFSGLNKLWKASLRSMPSAPRRPFSEALATEQHVERYPTNQEFSLADGAICFSAAAIVARIAIKTVIAVFPIFQPILWIAPLGLFCAAIYLLFIAKSSNSTLMYRLALAALGLFVSGSF